MESRPQILGGQVMSDKDYSILEMASSIVLLLSEKPKTETEFCLYQEACATVEHLLKEKRKEYEPGKSP